MAEQMSKAELRDFSKRIRSESRATKPLTVADLTCSDCVFRFDDSDLFKNGKVNKYGMTYGPVTACEKYSHKPQDVLNGGECGRKKAESEQE